MHSRILTFLNSHPQHAWTAREISRHLKIPPHERRELRNQLKKLAQEGMVIHYRGNRYSSPEERQTLIGTIKIHKEGYGFVLPDDAGETDVFIPAKYMNFALPSDRVLVSYQEKETDKRRDGKVLQILQHAQTHLVGQLTKKGRRFYVLHENFSTLMEILIPEEHLNKARIGQAVVAKITQYPSPSLPMMGEIIEVLGEPLDEETETLSILIKHHIRREFPRNVLSEIERIKETLFDEDYETRVDLRLLPIITIDGITAKDFDDAVCVVKKGKYYHLYVSIADVAHYISVGGALDQEALGRGTSVYFPDFAIPMLPEKLSNNLCSLKPGEDRLTLTCEMKLDQEGKVVEAWYYESVIRSQKRGTYDKIQSFFDGTAFTDEEFAPHLKTSLYDMKKLAELLIEQRTKRGGLDFDLPEAMIIYDQQGEITAITKAKRFFSHRLIEEFMISANVAVAELFTHHQIPALYRIHDFPDPLKVESFLEMIRHLGVKRPHAKITKPEDFAHLLNALKSHPMEMFLHQVLLRSMRLATYDAGNIGHFGLNLKNYCHFTSPIRRYPDLVVHRQLKYMIRRAPEGKIHFVLKGNKGKHPKKEKGSSYKSFYTPEQLAYFGKMSSQKEREAVEAEREMVEYKKSLFMRGHINEKFYGTIRRIAKFGLFVELEPHYVEGLLTLSELKDDYYILDEKRMRFVGRRNRRKTYAAGDKIWVQIKEVSLDKRAILLTLP